MLKQDRAIRCKFDMKAFSVFAAIVMLASITAFTSACSFLPKYNNPKNIEIDGETYVTGFYENLWVEGIVFGEDDAPNFETEYHIWWKVESSTFDMYCAQNKEALWWNPAIYCKKNQFDAAKKYYADAGNFNYYTGLYGDSNKNKRFLLNGNLNYSLLEEAIVLNMRIVTNSGKGLLTGKEDFTDIEVHVPSDEILPVQPVLYRVSKDGFFTTIQNDWIVTEKEVYIKGMYDGETKQSYTAYKIGNESNEYILRLLSENGII